MEKIKQENGAVPLWIQVDNGSEFVSKALDKWAYGYFGDADPLIPVMLTPKMGHSSGNTMS